MAFKASRGAFESPLARRSDYSSQCNRLERVRRLNSWSGGRNLPGILFGVSCKIFRQQYWNLEYSEIECCALAERFAIWRLRPNGEKHRVLWTAPQELIAHLSFSLRRGDDIVAAAALK
jgi:hypothetical protein